MSREAEAHADIARGRRMTLDEAAEALEKASRVPVLSKRRFPRERIASLYRIPFRLIGLPPVPAKAAHRRRFNR